VPSARELVWTFIDYKINILFLSIGESNAASDEIDLNDPEVNKAAVKIQASFRGHITRKKLEH
jgi:hypothetical protein